MKLSIITINYNNASDLEKTIHSVAKQTWRNFEYIIIDGGSKDDSIEVIKRNQQSITHWVSESDRGIYNAMNKGLNASHGDYCLFLNSGDTLISSKSINQIVEAIVKDPDNDIYYCNLKFRDKVNGRITDYIYPSSVSLGYFTLASLGHPATFISGRCLKDLEGYLENYRIISDWVFFVKAFLLGYKFKHVDTFCSIFETGGISDNKQLEGAERTLILSNEFKFLKTDFDSHVELLKYKSSKSHRIINKLLKYAGFRH